MILEIIYTISWGPYSNLYKLPIPGLIAKTEAKTEYTIEATLIREETLLAKEVLAPARGNKRYSNKES